MGGFCLLADLHQEGSALAACAAGLFHILNISVPCGPHHYSYSLLALSTLANWLITLGH